VGQHEGTDYLVMELVEGETLADRLKKGALPLDQTLRIAIEIADALDKAHRQGVIHRDLKPGNVMLTKSGSKLMDFGLAKLSLEGVGVGTVSALPTASAPLTGQGAILGTIPYMAPEQLEGKEAHARSDLWAFGCLLYEMATGRRAFEAKSQASLISAIMDKEPPPISQLQPLTPPSLERLVKVCLAKDPDDRFQIAHDVMQELRWIAETPSGSQAMGGGMLTPMAASRRRWTLAASGLALLVVGAALGAALAGRVWRTRVPISETPVVQLPLTPPDTTVQMSEPAVSHDGLHIAFVGTSPGSPARLWIRRVDEAEARPIEGTEDAASPFWAPDGRTLAFGDMRTGVLKRAGLTSPPRVITDAPEFSGGSWSPDGIMVFAPRFLDGLYRVAAGGGAPQPLTRLDAARKDVSHRFPQFLPDGRRFLVFVRTEQPEADGIFWGALNEPTLRRVARSDTMGTFVEPDLLLVVRNGVLEVQRLRMADLQPRGDAEPLLGSTRVRHDLDSQQSPITATRGIVAYVTLQPRLSRLVEFDRAGHRLRTIGDPGLEDCPSVSPNGERLITRRSDPVTGRMDLWLSEGRGAASPLVPSSLAGCATWLDQRRVVFSERLGFWRMRLLDLDHPSELRTLGAVPKHRIVAWAQGDRLLFAESGDSGWSLWTMRFDKEALAVQVVKGSGGGLSPDGQWLAFLSNVTGKGEISIQPFPGPGRARVVSEPGVLDNSPCWRADGRELFFLTAEGGLAAVPVTPSSPLQVGAPRVLFSVRPTPSLAGGSNLHCTGLAEAPRFIVREAVGPPPPEQLMVVVNWQSLLDHGRRP
jgi:hypothetical protein